MGKNHEDEIEKICMDMKKLIMKQDHTPTEVDAIHHYAEIVYYLTTTDAMNQAKEEGMFEMGGQSGRMMPPMYDYSMEGESMARGGRGGRGGRSNENYGGQSGRGSYDDMRGRSRDGSYERNMRGGGGGSMNHMPREGYDWQGECYSERY